MQRAPPEEIFEFAKRKGIKTFYYADKFSSTFEEISKEKPILVYSKNWLLLVKNGKFERYKVKRTMGETRFIPWSDLSLLNFSEKLDLEKEEVRRELKKIYESWCDRAAFWEFTGIMLNYEGDKKIRQEIVDVVEIYRRTAASYPSIQKEIKVFDVEFEFGEYSGNYLVVVYFTTNISIPFSFDEMIGGKVIEIAKKYKLIFAVIHGHVTSDVASSGDIQVSKFYRGLKVIKAEC